MRHNTPGGSILIVDDTLDNLRLLSHMLTERGYSVRAAKSGLEALASIQAAKPDLLLLDIKLPDLSGYEVCARLKADSATSDLPIVFLSVMDETKDKLQGFKAGGVDYITKPFHAEEVLARVHTHIEIGRLREELERQAVDLRDSQHLLMESQVIAGLGTYVLEIPKGTWTSSVVLDGIFGIDENYVRSVEGWGSLIHPDCRDMMLEYFAREVIAKCSLFDKEYKIVRHDNGEERWVHGLGEL
ncbi:MAG: response regulator, partial [Ignavibacteriales bacterium]|nr:response regulator [Ignavibacteriales bacterium]